MSDPDLTRFDFYLGENLDTNEETQHGFLIDWVASSGDPWTLTVEEQSLPNVVANLEDENYGFRDLQDTWRASWTNFSGGEGQERRDVSNGVGDKYYTSKFIDISREGELRLHRNLKLIEDPRTNSPTGNKASTRLSSSNTCIEWQGKIAILCTPINTTGSAANQRQVGIFDPQNPTANWDWIGQYVTITATACSAAALATDGDKLYVLYNGGEAGQAANQGLWSYTTADIGASAVNGTQLSTTANIDLVTRMVFAAGVLYLVSEQAADTKIGYYSSTLVGGENFVPVSATSIITPNLSCFGLAAVGSWVYAGTTGGGRSWVYAVQHDGANGVDNFQQYLELPAGFVGTSLCGYANMLFVGGYYQSRYSAAGQGAVFIATNSGVSKLFVIGDDPNEYTAGGTVPDTYKNQVYSLVGYDHWLYVLTSRGLYRWDIKNGGLNHIAESGAFSASSGSPGGLVTITWDSTISGVDYYGWTQGVDTAPGLNAPLLDHQSFAGSAVYEDDLYDVVTDDFLGHQVYSSTVDLHGDDNWRFRYTDTTTEGNFANGGAMNVVASHFVGGCFEMAIFTATKRAAVRFYGRYDSKDQIDVYVENSSDAVQYLASIAGKNDVHDLWLVLDSVKGTARLWVDGGATPLCEWTLLTGSYTAGMAYTLGTYLVPTTSVKDWSICLRKMRWAGGGPYDPTWTMATGSAAATQFAVAAGDPFMVSTAGSTDGLMTIDHSKYVKYPTDLMNGTLTTSETTLKMPTVKKYITNLDVFHDPINDADVSIVVTPIVDGSPQANLTIDKDTATDSLTSKSYSSVSGYAVKCEVQMFGNGTTTPVLHGISCRFSPLDNSSYLLRVDLRAARRDNTNLPVDMEAAIAYLIGLADSKKVVTLTTPYESHLVRVSALQFSGAAPNHDDEYAPQGIAVVRLKRVP